MQELRKQAFETLFAGLRNGRRDPIVRTFQLELDFAVNPIPVFSKLVTFDQAKMFLYVEYKAKDFHFDGASDVSSDEDLDDFGLDDESNNTGTKRKSTGSDEDGGKRSK